MCHYQYGRLAWRRGADFAVGETKVVSGKVSVDKYSGGLVMASPDIVAPLADLKKVRAGGGSREGYVSFNPFGTQSDFFHTNFSIKFEI